MKLWLTEKPDVGRDFAKYLGETDKQKSHIETNDGVVTWCYGHMLELAEPEDYDSAWKRWDSSQLPMVPSQFQSKPIKESKQQLKVIQGLIKKASEVIIATDPDREGEAIGREVLDHCKYRGKISRLWLNSKDDESTRKAINSLLSDADTKPLYRAAQARSYADWLVGMNMTRAMTLSTNQRGVLSVGRVQTPTLSLIVRRDREIANFKPVSYYDLRAHVDTENGHNLAMVYAPNEKKRIFDRDKAQSIIDQVKQTKQPVTKEVKNEKKAPPKLFDLTGFQMAANGKFSWSADKSLKVAQSLYEKHKLISYPRTDCTFLKEEQVSDVKTIVNNLTSLDDLSHLSIGEPIIRKTVFNTKKVEESSHYAIIPTTTKPNLSSLSADENKAYMLIARQFIASIMPDFEYEKTTLSIEPVDGVVFAVTGIIPQKYGWREVMQMSEENEEKAGNKKLPPVEDGEQGTVKDAEILDKATQPPKHYTEKTLLGDMESVSKYVEDKQHQKMLKESKGIGRPSTRPAIIETLKRRGFIAAEKKKIVSTDKGTSLLDRVMDACPSIADPCETARWEDALYEMEKQKGDVDIEPFLSNIARNIENYLNITKKMEQQANNDRKTGVEAPNGNEFMEFDEAWKVDGYEGVFKKKFIGRDMTLDDYKKILESSEPVEFDGFVSKKGKNFSAKLEYSEDEDLKYKGIQLVFESNNEQKGETVGTCEYGDILDCGTFYTFSDPEKKFRIYKESYGRTFTPEDVQSIVSAGEEGVKFEDLQSRKTGKVYSAKVFLNLNAKPHPKLELNFDS